jgi:hypothetical protein
VLHVPPISLDLATRIIFRVEHRSLSSSLCISFLHSAVTSSLAFYTTSHNSMVCTVQKHIQPVYISV